MYRSLGVAVLCGLVFGANLAAEGKSDLDKIQGKWQCVSGIRNGKAMPEDEAKKIVVTITKDKLVMMRDDQKNEIPYKLDPSKSPKWMDVELPGGKTGTGIYSLEGDTLKVCHGEEGDARPSEFTSKEGTKLTCVEFKRVK